jgi:hypothetical protein
LQIMMKNVTFLYNLCREKAKLFRHFHGDKQKINVVFLLFMFCLQCQHHHCM